MGESVSDKPPEGSEASPEGDQATAEAARGRRSERLRERIRHAELSLPTRLALFIAGWTLVLIGIAGLALPGIQGILTILVGMAVLSVASKTAHQLLYRLLGRWPAVWDRIDRFRDRVHDWLSRD